MAPREPTRPSDETQVLHAARGRQRELERRLEGLLARAGLTAPELERALTRAGRDPVVRQLLHGDPSAAPRGPALSPAAGRPRLIRHPRALRV